MVLRRLLIVTLILLTVPVTGMSNLNSLFVEDFKNLDQWKPLFFPNIEKHTQYTIVTEGEEHYLRAESHASASGLVHSEEFNVYEYPRMRWRWKVENVYRNGDALSKEGDDYPIRIYVLFKYDPERAGFPERIKYSAARLIYGEYPPHSSLNYIWASKPHLEKIIPNAYTDQSKMVLLEMGEEKVGRWVIEEVNIIEDYQRAFGRMPPELAGLAIMNDSDNTDEAAVSYVDYIEVLR